eukprot:8078071-Pyramimonas_sp.AAC.1
MYTLPANAFIQGKHGEPNGEAKYIQTLQELLVPDTVAAQFVSLRACLRVYLSAYCVACVLVALRADYMRMSSIGARPLAAQAPAVLAGGLPLLKGLKHASCALNGARGPSRRQHMLRRPLSQ